MGYFNHLVHWLGPLALAACLGCRASPQPIQAGSQLIQGVPPAYLAAFTGLRESLEAGENATAWGIARRIRARITQRPGQDEALLELLEGFERILLGREVLEHVRLRLFIEPAESGHSARVVLVGSTLETGGIELRADAGTLQWERTVLLPNGMDSTQVSVYPLPALDPWLLDAAEGSGWFLHTYDRRIPIGALAVNDRWVLRLLSGGVLAREQLLPAMNMHVEFAERVELAEVIPSEPVRPHELYEAAAAHRFSVPALLERTVRIIPSQREEALALLAPLLETWTPEQIARLVPSLRWLAMDGDRGRDPHTWRAWLREWATQRTQNLQEPTSLDLGALDI